MNRAGSRRHVIRTFAAIAATVSLLGSGLIATSAASASQSSGTATLPTPATAKPVKGHAAAATKKRNAGDSSITAPAPTNRGIAAGHFDVRTPKGAVTRQMKTRGAKGSVESTVVGPWQKVGSTGLELAPASTEQEATTSSVSIDVLSAAEAKKHGLTGITVRLTRIDSSSDSAPVALAVPASTLSGVYGADYASRVRWVQVPDTGSAPAASTPVASAVDATSKAVVVTPKVTAKATLLTAAAAPISSTGTGSFAATPLKSASSWDVSEQSGDFTWQYAMRTPPAAAGPQPSLSLSYDSQAIDGETGSTNNQPSAIGEGWELGGSGYIERTYVSCSQDDGASGPVTTSGDLCWKTDNATISIAGHSGTLVRVNATSWKLQADDGTRFEHLVGAAAGCGAANGTYDNDCWRMTTTDGTKYYFGMNELPGYASAPAATKFPTNSAWLVPVYGNDATEPCHNSTFATSSCAQAWRWNLDYVVDTHNNAEAFYYDAEGNRYARGGSGSATYTRGGQLDHIDYGLTAANIYTVNAATDKVAFGYNAYGRCTDTTHANCTSEAITAAAVAPAHPTYYPDVPFDQLCTSTTSCSTSQISPTFFTDGMLNTVTTKAWISGAYQTVDTWTLSHSFPAPGDTSAAALWMTQVSHTGSAAGQTSLTEPPTVFGGVAMQNRVWVVDGRLPLDKYRINSITTSLGAVISVTYSAQQCTPAGAAAIEAAPESNTNWCFPEWWAPQVVPAVPAKTDLFHKYVVRTIIADPKTGGPLDQSQEADYSYGTPRWRYDTSPLIPTARRTWNQYAGVDTVEVRVGDHNTPSTQQVTDYTYFQGMDGDRATASGGTKSVNVHGTSIPDSRWFAGQVYEQKTLAGVGGTVLSDTINTPWASAVTANDGTNTARMTDVSDSVVTEPVSTGGTRTVHTTSTFDPTYGFPLTVSTVASDASSTCTTTTHTAANTTAWIIGLPSEVKSVGVSCPNLASASYPADLISDTQTYYDSTALGVAPTKGDATSTKQVDGYTSGTPHWSAASTAAYDSLGRLTATSDVLGHTTTTAYTPATGGPVTSIKVTNTAPFSWPTTTAYNPEWGVETSVTDPNGHLTTATYDALGRRTQVWLPQHTQSANPSAPSISYAYTLSQTAANAIQTTRLTATSTDVRYDLFDGLGQQVQSQQPADGSGSIISATAFDAAGRSYLVDNPYWTTSVSPSSVRFQPATEATIPSQLSTTYDGAGRPVKAITNQTGTERFETDYAYSGADRTDVTPPGGGTPTSTFTNSIGEKTKLVQYLSATPTGASQATTYSYDAAGRMTGMSDPAGNHWTWGFDVLGHQTTAIDPDTGTTTATYDDGGNQLTSTDARGQLLTYTYDALNRKTAEYAGTAAGSLLASWTYDTIAKGLVTSAKSYIGSTVGVPGIAYATTVGAYDAAGMPSSTTVSIPAGAPAFAGTSYTFTNLYNVDETMFSQSDPAVGGLPAESVRHTYTPDGRLNAVTVNGLAVSGVFTPIRQLSTLTRYVPPPIGQNPAYSGTSSYGYDLATGQLMTRGDTTLVAGAGHIVADREYTRDDAGNVTSVTNTAAYPTASTQVDCYSYDHLGELTQVWSPGSASACGDTPSVSALSGPAPLWEDFTYDTTTGNRTGQTVHDTTGTGSDKTAAYVYPAAGAAQPHTVTGVTGAGAPGAGSYGYDAAGNTTSRPGQTLTYNAVGKLSTVTTSAGVQQNVYDASGSLLLQVDPSQGGSLFLGDTVLHQTGTGPVSGVRTYSFGDTSAVERTATAGVTGSTLVWLFSDIDGSVEVQTIATSGSTTTQYRDPFGNGIGGTTGTWISDGTGYLNRPSTASAGLIALGHRTYDPLLGRFLNPDAIQATGNPQQLNGYSYSANSPVTLSDPSGDCYNAASDVMTTNQNCAGGHGANADDGPTAQAKKTAHRMQAIVAGVGPTKNGYDHKYSLGRTSMTSSELFLQVREHFGEVFPPLERIFTSDKDERDTTLEAVGQVIHTELPFFPVQNGNIVVTRLTSTGYQIAALPGHPEYPGAVTFTFTKSHTGEAFLRVQATYKEPLAGLSNDAYAVMTEVFWNEYASNVNHVIVDPDAPILPYGISGKH